jgi:hypothetical protein
LIGSNKKATTAILDEIVEKNMCYSFRHVLSNSVAGEAKEVGAIFAFLIWSLSNNKPMLKNFDYSNEALVDYCICHVRQYLSDIESMNLLGK